MKKVFLTSASLAALLTISMAQAQTQPGAGGADRKEAPAGVMQKSEPAGAARAQKAGDSDAARGGEERKAASPGAAEPRGPERQPATAAKPEAAPSADHDRRGTKASSDKAESGAPERGRAERPTAAPKTGQNPSAEPNRATSAGGGKPEPDRAAAPTAPDRERSGRQTGEGAQDNGSARTGAASSGAGARENLDERRQTQLREVVRREKSARVDHVDFSLSVGVRVPSHVHFRPLPREIVSIVPQYRGYDYIVVDEEIVIIEPRTREIVTVLSTGGREGRGRVPAHRARLDTGQQHVVFRDAMRDARPVARSMRVTVGERIPDDVELLPMPGAIVADVPDVRDFRYFVLDREVVLVDPGTREVVEVIRE